MAAFSKGSQTGGQSDNAAGGDNHKPGIARFDLEISGMSCAACSSRVERGLQRMAGVERASVNLAAGTAAVVYRPQQVNPSDLIRAVERIGYSARPLVAEDVYQGVTGEDVQPAQRPKLLILSAVLSLPFAVMMLGQFLRIPLPPFLTSGYTQFLLATPVQLAGGFPFYRGAFSALRNRSANMDVLVAMGSSAAFFYSLVVTLGWLEGHVYYETAAV
ncbi:MAG: cation transporter, partial [Syntrophomonadaceae bacterium]|nr:cation transporter [Syntrophomonadaceae bacterium]